MSDYSAKVIKGIKLLDSEKPGWRSDIDLDKLDLGSCSVCVLGQIFGDYEVGVEELDIDGHEYGFNTLGSMVELTQAWKDALGKNNVLVEKGDVYTDKGGCCAVKVLSTTIAEINGKQVTLYITLSGNVSDGVFKAYETVRGGLAVSRKEAFEPGGYYSTKIEPFKFEEGMFVTNDTGNVYYIKNASTARLVSSSPVVVWTDEIDKEGLRELTLSSGLKFSDTIKK